MVEKIKRIKDDVLEFMERDISQRGIENINVKLQGELADIVKDLAEAEESCWEAEYYRTVTEAMGSGSSGYTQPQTAQDMQQGGRRGYGSGSMANGGTMGHTDITSIIRDMLAAVPPETRSSIRKELGM